jgi:hypothetical protein
MFPHVPVALCVSPTTTRQVLGTVLSFFRQVGYCSDTPPAVATSACLILSFGILVGVAKSNSPNTVCLDRTLQIAVSTTPNVIRVNFNLVF